VLVVHVTANDFSTEVLPSALGDSVFGTLGDTANLASQYEACSYGTKKFVPAVGANIVDGVASLTISIDVKDVSDGTVRNAVTAAGNVLFGDIRAQADHVMYALPSNTSGSWIAYAYVDSWLSVYNDKWATYLSAQMHEVGHNLDVAHSNEGGTEYADQSGMMGYSYSQDDGPVMCFNAAKSSRFSWYNNKELSFDNESWSGKVVGLADYNVAAADHNVLLKIRSKDGNNDAKTLSVTYNRKIGINSGTLEAGDQLMVVETETSTRYSPSTLLAKLSNGETYTYANYWGTGKDFRITVDNIGTDPGSVEYAMVSISNGAVLAEYELTVNSGNGDGVYTVGATVNIVADTAPSGQEFDKWVTESGSATFESATNASTVLTMGSVDTSVLATYRNIFELTVNQGAGDGSYAESVEVNISADAPATGQVFYEWVVNSGSATIELLKNADTLLTMSAGIATITATYINVYTLTVNNGSGDGNYSDNFEVEITADAAPSLQEFDRWVIESGTATIASPTNANTMLTMGAGAASITATYRVMPVLTVNNGSGGGSYSEGTEVTIIANAPPSLQEFDQWVVEAGSVTFASVTDANTTLISGTTDSSITATYRNLPVLTVNKGQGDGSYTTGSIVSITADAASSGEEFVQWVVNSGSATITSPTSTTAALTTGSTDTVVTATYRNIYALIVNNGSGDGSYAEGTNVTITANGAPNGQEFNQWVFSSGSANILSTSNVSTTLTMGTGPITITATYRNIYALTIDNGTGSGVYAAGTEVMIVANLAPSGQEFDQWIVSSGTASFALTTNVSTTLVTGAEATVVSATYRDVYTLTVENGVGNGMYAEGIEVTIIANVPPSGQEFDQWIVSLGSATIASPTNANTTIMMGSGNTTATATYRDVFGLTIQNGSGTGVFAAGIEVVIIASTAPDLQEFEQWVVTSGTATIALPTSASTTLITGGEDAIVTATYSDMPVLTISSGSGDGSYTAGTQVNIIADVAPTGQEFDQWVVTSGMATFVLSTSANTTLTTGSADASVTATYSDIPITEVSSSGTGSSSLGLLLMMLVLLLMNSKRFQLKVNYKYLL
jgi:hypothetical protein